MRTLVLLLVMVAGCAATPNRCETIAAGGRRPFLWSVAGSGGSLVLFGTHQTAGADDVPREAWAALDAAGMYVSETGEVAETSDFHARRGWQDAYELPEGHSLRELVTPREYLVVSEILGDVAHTDLKRLKPWVAMFAIAKTVFAFPSPSINEALLARATRHGIKTASLETFEDQVRYLDAAIGGAKLAQAIHDYHSMECRLEHDAAAYRAGADEAFINDVRDEREPVVQRIQHWLPSIEALAEGGRHPFIAVGVGELLGPHGLLVELDKRGYVVRRM